MWHNKLSGIVIAVLTALLLFLAGHLQTRTWIYLGALALLGALFPPAAIIIGGAVLLYLIMNYGAGVMTKLAGLAKGGKVGG